MSIICKRCGNKKKTERAKYCPICTREIDTKAHRKYREKKKRENPEKYKQACQRYSLKTLYGITLEQYELMVREQNGRCAICFNLPKENKKLFVDHCHSTNIVRGLLCHNCNAGLGHYFENVDIMNSAITYIKKYKENS